MKSYRDEASLTSLPRQIKQSQGVAQAAARKANFAECATDLSLQSAHSIKRNYMGT
jgi:hypothetical protein